MCLHIPGTLRALKEDIPRACLRYLRAVLEVCRLKGLGCLEFRVYVWEIMA